MADITNLTDDKIRAPAAWGLATLAALGLISGMYVAATPGLPVLAKLIVVGLLSIAGAGWLLSQYNEQLSGLLMVAGLAGMIFCAQAWFAIPGTLALLSIPVWLAMALLGWRASAAAAVLSSVALAWLANHPGYPLETSGAWLAALSIWGGLAAVSASYAPIQRLARWTWEYYEINRARLVEAQERQVQLARALDDLTHVNRQLSLLNERISAYRQAAEEARRTKEKFVAQVSHEFRGPLNIIIGMVSLMVDSAQTYRPALADRAIQHLTVIHRSCRHLAGLIDDVLDLSQAEERRTVLRHEPVSLPDLVDSALEIVRPLIENKGLALKVEAPDTLPLVACDRLRIRQVILNLLSNAARYTERGQVTVRIGLDNQQALIEVSDTGPGIAPENITRVFEAFSPVGRDTRRELGGSGLGLSISKQFVELHHGTLSLESTLGQGSTFLVRLPVAPPDPPRARPGQWISDEWVWKERQPQPGRPDLNLHPRVVVCDETGHLTAFLQHAAKDWELVTTTSLDQAQAAIGESPAYGLLVNQPNLFDLPATVARLRGENKDPAVDGASGAVAICCSIPHRIDAARQAGADGYILKPLTSLALDRLLDSFDLDFDSILVVDDDEDTRLMMTELIHLYEPQIEVLSVGDGPSALQVMRARRPSLVLMDILMPEMTGWEVLAAKQADPDLKPIPMVMVSAQELSTAPLTTPYLLAISGEDIPLARLVDSLSYFNRLFLPASAAEDETAR